MVNATEKKKCPICFHALKYLYERVHVKSVSKNGKEYNKHVYKKHLFFCKYCDLKFPLDLQQTVDDLKNLI